MMKSFGHNLRRLSSADAASQKSRDFVPPEVKHSSLKRGASADAASQKAVFVPPEVKKSSLKRGASLGQHDYTKNFRKAETENRDENETDDLIAVTKQKINKE